MPKFELSIVHRQDDGIAKSVNKIEADNFLNLILQFNVIVAQLAEEIRVKEHEDNYDFPF